MLLIFAVFFAIGGIAQTSVKYTVSGSIKDKVNGETMPGATVFIKELKTGTVTNVYGFYSISLAKGTYSLVFSYVGYEPVEQQIILSKNIIINTELSRKQQELKEVTITGSKGNENIISTETGTIKVEMEAVKKIPALLGEIDVIKAIQLLPGVQTAAEGSSGFSVRGGNPDQNLIVLDEATVYNASHLMGFFSVFNQDAIKDFKLYKGDIPAEYGGRLSSLVDVRMKEGNMKHFTVNGGIGTIASRLTIEAPIVKDKSSFIISGRRTYADIFLPLAKDPELRDNKLHFYDVNAKVNLILDQNNRIFVSGYLGEDIFLYSDRFGFSFGNQTLTLRWNHLFSSKLFCNYTVIYSKYNYKLFQTGATRGFDWQSYLTDYGGKVDFSYYFNLKNTMKFGAFFIHHKFNPGVIKSSSTENPMDPFYIPQSRTLDYGIYAGNEQKFGSRLTVDYGLRFTVYQNIGFGTDYKINDQFEVTDTLIQPRGHIYHTYYGIEPRISASFVISQSSSLKASYARTNQFMQIAQNSTAGSALDIWFTASPNVKPQMADQVSVGYFHNFFRNVIEASIELYYKKMYNQIDFKDHAELILNPKLEAELRFGTTTAYGAEFFIRKNTGKLTGWVSYTLSKAERRFRDINNGNPYPAPYDKTHNLAIVINYDITRKISLGANWVYYTGNPITLPTGRFFYTNTVIPVYSDRNSYRMPDYHRLDFSFTYKFNPGGRFRTELNLSLYNVYARHNPWMYYFDTAEGSNDPNVMEPFMIYLFTIVPALTLNFHF